MFNIEIHNTVMYKTAACKFIVTISTIGTKTSYYLKAVYRLIISSYIIRVFMQSYNANSYEPLIYKRIANRIYITF